MTTHTSWFYFVFCLLLLLLLLYSGEAEGGRDPVRQISSDERVIDGDIVINKKAIGSGAFGSVFKGRLGGQPCAVKILHPHALQLFTSLETTVQQEALQKFREECKILERFRHPNVVRHLSSRTDPRSNLPVLVMELMDESLTRFLEKPSTALSLFTEASLSFDIASALQFLHSENIVHHDLCSDNVLLLHTEQTPIAKISDFGMSRILDPDQCRSLTTLGHREAHLPPEARKIASKEYDASLDIFSFGVVVVQIVTKSSKVARAADRDALVEQIEATHPLCSLVHDCIRVEKEMRPNANDVCHDLESKVENLKTL